MRMWMVDPKILCSSHLNGEHYEIHKHLHMFKKKHSIKNRVYPNPQIEPLSILSRHNELAKEMAARGMSHNSPIRINLNRLLKYLNEEERCAKVNENESLELLLNRCEKCRERYHNENKVGILS